MLYCHLRTIPIWKLPGGIRPQGRAEELCAPAPLQLTIDHCVRGIVISDSTPRRQILRQELVLLAMNVINHCCHFARASIAQTSCCIETRMAACVSASDGRSSGQHILQERCPPEHCCSGEAAWLTSVDSGRSPSRTCSRSSCSRPC